MKKGDVDLKDSKEGIHGRLWREGRKGGNDLTIISKIKEIIFKELNH